MANNRIIYQSDALYASRNVRSVDSGDHVQLRRIQSANYSFTVNRQDVNQFGQLSRIDSIILETPTVSFDTTYLLGDGFNEQALNFANSADLDKGFISGQIESTSGINLYIISAKEGVDINTIAQPANNAFSTIGMGNMFLTDYTVEASVGSLPTVTCSFEGINMNATANVTGTSSGFFRISGVGVDPKDGTVLPEFTRSVVAAGLPHTGVTLPPPSQSVSASAGPTSIPSALRPGDIQFTLSGANDDTIVNIGGGNDTAHVQSVSLSIPMSRTPIERLGPRFAYSRVVDFPIVPTLSVSAIVNETQTRALTNITASDDFIPFLQIQFNDSDPDSTPRARYKMSNVKLDSESFSSSIGPNKAVDLSFSVSIGGPSDLNNNIFFSGSNTGEVFQVTGDQASVGLGNARFGAPGID